MKSEGVHITLCYEHCGARADRSSVKFDCPWCWETCEPNDDVAGALMKMAKLVQAMTPAEVDQMLLEGERNADQD